MKALLFGAFLLFIGTPLYAQEHDISSRNVSQEVLTTFSQKFSKATDVEWEEVYGDYQASFEIGDVDHHAAFTSAGKLLSHSFDLSTNEVPSKIKSAFAKKFKNATDMEWEKEIDRTEKDGSYISSFEIGEVDHKATFSSSGALKKHAYEITKNELPSAVTSKIKEDYPDYKLEDITMIKSEKKEVTYKVELEGKPDLNLRFDKKGHVLMKIIDR